MGFTLSPKVINSVYLSNTGKFIPYHQEYDELLTSLGVSKIHRISALIWDARFALTTAGLAGLGRATSEVGAVMIVGGNIDQLTRVMTTSIALESRRGDLVMALALGFILIIFIYCW